MTQNQGQQLLNDMDTVIARLNNLLTDNDTQISLLQTIRDWLDQIDVDIVDFAGIVDTWFLTIYMYRYPIMMVLLAIFTLLAMRGGRDN